jgi:hypothetical protein
MPLRPFHGFAATGTRQVLTSLLKMTDDAVRIRFSLSVQVQVSNVPVQGMLCIAYFRGGLMLAV